MQSTAFYTVVVGLTSGIFLRSFFDIRVFGTALFFLLSFVLALAWRLRAHSYHSLLFLLSLFLLCTGIGIVRLDISEGNVSPLHDAIGDTRVFEGVVVREPDARQTSTHLYVRETETHTLMLVIVDPFTDVSYGDRVSVQGALKEPEPFETDTGRTFDYRGYLKAKGVSEMISYGDITIIANGNGNAVLSILYAVKERIIDALERAIPAPAVGLGEGLLLGVKRALGDNLTEMFRVAGIIHIVVLSGYNIMIVAESIMRVLGYFFFPRTRLLVGIAAIVLFALMVGLSSTVVRASIMAGLVLIARHTGRDNDVVRALSLTGVAMLLLNPYLLAFDPGFQLSFLATLGLILFAPHLESRFTLVPEWYGIRGYLASTIGTQIYVLPVLLFSMGTLSLVSVFVNMLVLPLVPFAMFLTFIVGLVGLVSDTLALACGFFAHFILAYIIKVAEWSTLLPFASLNIPAFSFWLVIAMYFLIGTGTWWLARRSPATIPVNRNGGDTRGRQNVVNDYEGWVIEVEKERPLGTQSVPSAHDPLPFR